LVIAIGVACELSIDPPGTEYPTTVEVGRAFLPVDVTSSFFNREAQDFFTGGVAGVRGAGGVISTSVLSFEGSAAAGISTSTAVEGVEGDLTGDALDIEAREDIGEAGVVISWTEGVAVVVSVTGDGESVICVWAVGGSSNASMNLSRSGSSGMLTAA
jgi:hypothetical protein